MNLQEWAYRMKLRQALIKATTEQLVITRQELNRETERRNKKNAKKNS